MNHLKVDVYRNDREVFFHVPRFGLVKAKLEEGNLDRLEEKAIYFGKEITGGGLEKAEFKRWGWEVPIRWRKMKSGYAGKRLLTFYTPRGAVVLNFSYFGGTVPVELTRLLSHQVRRGKRAKPRKEAANAQGLDEQADVAAHADQDRLRSG